MRPVFIGDVQGCARELEELLAAVHAELGADIELWFVGDLVNRGPDNLRVLERVRDLQERGRAKVVLGNHDVAMLSTGLGLRALRPQDNFTDVLDRPDGGDWVEWLRRRSLVETGRLGEREFAMVHAAVPADWTLATLVDRARAVGARLGHADPDQARAFLGADPRRDAERLLLARLTRCRSVDAAGAWSHHEPAVAADAWHARWGAARHAYGVVYGHWSLQGLHVAPGIRGLDTGCVHGGRLTAWLPDCAATDPFAVPDDGFRSAQAQRRYFVDPETGSPAASSDRTVKKSPAPRRRA